MPTIVGLRRRGYTPEAINDLCNRTGVSKTNTVIEIQLLEHCIREDLNKRRGAGHGRPEPAQSCDRELAEGADGAPLVEWVDATNNPEDESMGTRKVPFSGALYIEAG